MWRTHSAKHFAQDLAAARETLRVLMQQASTLTPDGIERLGQKLHIQLGDMSHDFGEATNAPNFTAVQANCRIGTIIEQAAESLGTHFAVDPSCVAGGLVVKNYRHSNVATTHKLALICVLQILQNAKKRLPPSGTGKDIRIECKVIAQPGAGGKTLRWARLLFSNPIDPNLRLSPHLIPDVGRRAIFIPSHRNESEGVAVPPTESETHTGALMVGAIARGDLDGDFYVRKYDYDRSQITIALELPIIDEVQDAPNV
jgi:hypothetical protein